MLATAAIPQQGKNQGRANRVGFCTAMEKRRRLKDIRLMSSDA